MSRNVRNVIYVDVKRPDRSLVRLPAAKGSSLEFTLAGLPSDLQRVFVHVGRPNAATVGVAEASLLPDGTWSVYLSGFYFPVAGTAEWFLSAKDRLGNAKWFGRGAVDIADSSLDVSGETPPTVVPEDTYLQNPETGLWHKLSVRVVDGLLVPSIEEEGIVR